MLSTGQPRGFMSRPMQVQVPGLGLESTTTRMQQSGWDFSAEQDIRLMMMNICARHRAARLFLVASMPMDYFRAFEDSSYLAGQTLVFNGVQSRTQQTVVPSNMFDNYQPIDMMPRYVETPVVDVQDLQIFASAPLARTNEIIVEEREVKDLLADILAKQEDGRQEHFKRQLAQNREGMVDASMPNFKFHAQIMSIA